MSLKSRITDDMKAAMKAKEAQRLSAIRLLLAAIKQRRDSIAQFQAANRKDLVDVETFELNLLTGYLPKQLSDAEVEQEVAAAMAQTGAKGVADMGKVMGVLKPKLAGRADLAKVSAMVKAKLAA